MDRVLQVANYIKSFLAGDYNITKYNSSSKQTICGFDGFISLKYNSSSNISKYSVKLGDFSSYNKILQPDNLEITVCTTGTFEKISSVIFMLNNYKNSIELVDIQTPYGVYIGFNIVDLEYEVSAENGVGYLECIIKARQIEVSSAQFTAIKNIESRATNILGKVSLVQNTIQQFHKATSITAKTALGAQLIFGNRIKFR